MRRIAKIIAESVGNDETTALQVVSPWFQYIFLMALWCVIFASSLWLTLLFYAIFIVVAWFGRINPFRLWLVLVFVLLVVVGSAAQRLAAGSALNLDLLRLGLKTHLLFGSAPVIFARTTAIQHFYAWSSLLGGALAGAIVGMGRGIKYLPRILFQTHESFKMRGSSLNQNPLPFAMSLMGSVIHFSRTYIDALEMRGLSGIRGEGELHEPFSVVEALLLCISILLVVSVYLEHKLST